MPNLAEQHAPLRYWAFISYARADSKWAKRVHASLEGFDIPAAAKEVAMAMGLNAVTLRPVFRDVDELAAGKSLSAGLRSALDESAFLIVICSPRSARSSWVNAEVQHVMESGRADRILLFLVDGEPTLADESHPRAAFPSVLKDLPDEPVWVDARDQGDPRQRAIVRLAAGMLQVRFDDLWRRERRRQRRRFWTRSASVGTVAAVVAGLLYVQSQPIDIADCPVGALIFRDPWIGGEFAVQRVGTNYYYLCGDTLLPPREARARADCSSILGHTVFEGVATDGLGEHKPETVYFVYQEIKGAPCCWWSKFDRTGVEEIIALQGFRWLTPTEEPPLGAFPFNSIELEEYSERSESLQSLNNPYIAAVCEESRLSAFVSQLRSRRPATRG